MTPHPHRSTTHACTRLVACVLALACSPAPAPTPPPQSSASHAPPPPVLTPTNTPPSAPSPAPPPPSSASTAPPPPSSSADHPADPATASPTPPLLSETGTPLPQTEDRPSADSALLKKNLELLVAAIANDDPARALPAFFPVVAYTQVKAIERPERDWKHRLVGAFERDIHEYHRALGADARNATLLGIDVPEPAVKWMKPGKEGNKVGYFRVLRSKLKLGLGGGRERALEITSLISWRGEWYVVHLSGFD